MTAATADVDVDDILVTSTQPTSIFDVQAWDRDSKEVALIKSSTAATAAGPESEAGGTIDVDGDEDDDEVEIVDFWGAASSSASPENDNTGPALEPEPDAVK